jgi:hypothetical protein
MKEDRTERANRGVTIECRLDFQTGHRGQKKIREVESASDNPEANRNNCEDARILSGRSAPHGRIPRISKLMALAIHFDGLLRQGIVRDYADIARLGGISRARVTQIMNLLLLAPQIQEALLYMPMMAGGNDPITEHEMREEMKTLNWKEQQKFLKRHSELSSRILLQPTRCGNNIRMVIKRQLMS